MELASKEMDNLQNQINQLHSVNQEKEETISSLRKNLEFFVNKPASGSSNRRELEKEIARLMSENERLRTRVVELQRQFEQKESELIGEINKLIIEINDGRTGGNEFTGFTGSGIGGMSIHKMVENIKLQNELRNRDILIDQILQVLSEEKRESMRSRDSPNTALSKFTGSRMDARNDGRSFQ